jgi:hypothetical protein
MPSQQPDPLIPLIEVSTIKEEELRKPGVAKILYKQFAELRAANQELISSLDGERNRREQLAAQLSQVDARRQVLEERVSALGNRNAICQLIWAAMALVLGLGIDFVKSQQWTAAAFTVAVTIFLGVAAYLANRTSGAP